LKIKSRNISFSFWPMGRSTRRYGLRPHVFATDPWTIISSSVQHRCPAGVRQTALAFIEQAEDFFRAAMNANAHAAKPLLLYYCFMNVAKAYILTVGQRNNVDRARHGLSEQLGPGGKELSDAFLEAFAATPNSVNVFDELQIALTGHGLGADQSFLLTRLLPQVIQGHRLWCLAAKEPERFVSVERISFWSNAQNKSIWLRIYLYADDLTRIGAAHGDVLTRTGLNGTWHEVQNPQPAGERRLLCFEQLAVQQYGHRPSDQIPALIQTIKSHIWANILSIPPYRKYYIYLAPPNTPVLPQILSVYAIIFHLGSVTRYRPQNFDKIILGEFGAQIQEIITNQPSQFVYLMASEFAQQEVTRAAIVF
jgi:YaaC-like Protein